MLKKFNLFRVKYTIQSTRILNEDVTTFTRIINPRHGIITVQKSYGIPFTLRFGLHAGWICEGFKEFGCVWQVM